MNVNEIWIVISSISKGRKEIGRMVDDVDKDSKEVSYQVSDDQVVGKTRRAACQL